MNSTANIKQHEEQINELEKAAKKFINLVNNGHKRDAMAYFNTLPDETKGYISTNYNPILVSAKIQF